MFKPSSIKKCEISTFVFEDYDRAIYVPNNIYFIPKLASLFKQILSRMYCTNPIEQINYFD